MGGGDGGSRMFVCYFYGSRNFDCINDDVGRYGNCFGVGIVDDVFGSEFVVIDYVV